MSTEPLPPGYRPAPPGLELAIWRRIPALLTAGTLGPLLASLLWRWTAPDNVDPTRYKSLLLMDYTMIGVVLMSWTLLLTLALGCWIVMIMKGPPRSADAYPLPDRDAPAPDDDDREGLPR